MAADLVEQVEVSTVGTPGRPPQTYRAVGGMDRSGVRQFRLLAEVLVGAVATCPKPAAEAERAGREWGRRKAESMPEMGNAGGTGGLTALLDEIGFQPEPAGPRQIALSHCPFLDLAETEPDIVCTIHRGLMEGALEGWRSPLRVRALEPWAEPDRCIAHLESGAVR